MPVSLTEKHLSAVKFINNDIVISEFWSKLRVLKTANVKIVNDGRVWKKKKKLPAFW